MERWRLLETWGASPELAMGLDEALLDLRRTPPTLRLYTWEPDTLSLGYFQRCADVPDRARAGAARRPPPGGPALHHAGELTFSIALSLSHPLYRGPISESYRRVHGLLLDALAAVGVAGRLREELALHSDREGSGMCFAKSTDVDIVWEGRKGIGSAQRRRHDRVLHHGSIKLAGSALEVGIATVEGIGEREFAPHLVQAFERGLGIELVPGEPTERELAEAALRGPHYTSAEFVRRR